MLGALFISSLCIIAAALARSDDSKIVGGRFVDDVTSIPFIVSVQVKKIGHNCGGSLLTMSYVLSACHCLADVATDDEPLYVYDPDKFLFVAGETDFEGDKTHSQVREARVFHIHPKCARSVTIIHDFAAGEMKEPFLITEYVKPFQLLTTDADEFENEFQKLISDDGTNCQVAGWGETRRGNEENPVASTKLKAVRMYIIEENNCQELYGQRERAFATFPFWVYGQVCAVSRTYNESDCLGDSGSPFFCDDYVVGVVSYGYECGTFMPSVYTGLKFFLEWFMSEVYPLRPGHDLDDPLNNKLKTNGSLLPQAREPEGNHRSGGTKISAWTVCILQYCAVAGMIQTLWALF